jgi:hypothetical protein
VSFVGGACENADLRSAPPRAPSPSSSSSLSLSYTMHQPSDLPARLGVGIFTFSAEAAWWAAEAAAAAMLEAT